MRDLRIHTMDKAFQRTVMFNSYDLLHQMAVRRLAHTAACLPRGHWGVPCGIGTSYTPEAF